MRTARIELDMVLHLLNVHLQQQHAAAWRFRSAADRIHAYNTRRRREKKMVTHITLHIHTQTAYHSTYIICVFMGAWHKMDGRQILLKRARARARALNKRI